MPFRQSVKTLALALLALGVSAVAAAQVASTGTVSGAIKDAQGGALPGATVTLISESRGTRSAPAVTSGTGEFVFPNVAADTYTVQVEMPSFKTVRQTGVRVDAQSRVTMNAITLEVGGVSEVVNVAAEVPLIQATTGERSFTVATESVQNLPLQSRTFTALAGLAPGINGLDRIGGGGDTNIMMDGVSSVSPGNNAPLLLMNVESIAEVKVVTSGYQAEYGRSSGAQINAVTRSGTNRFRGSVYDVERNSDWNANSRTNILNGDPKNVTRQRDFGFSIGGPVGRPGGSNKLFFFYSQEFQPRQAGNDVSRFRLPTALERTGDFSQTTDNNGVPYSFIRDFQRTGNCNANSQAACFNDGGVLGRIPQNRLYAPGIAVLNMYPLPNIANVPAGQNYNYEITRPEESALGTQPAIRIDYQFSPNLRFSGKLSMFQQRHQVFNGSLPGFNDSGLTNAPIRATSYQVNYTITPTTFVEAVFGQSTTQASGCNLGGGGTGPSFCNNGWPMSPFANRVTAGLGGLPLIFPDASLIDQKLLVHKLIDDVRPEVWQDGRILLPPLFAWGNRVANAPPNNNMTSNWNNNRSWDFTVSLTKVAGRHTFKTGFYTTQANREVNVGRGNNTAFGAISFAQDTNNLFDTTFGYANAAVGTFNSFTQASSYIEVKARAYNIEGYVQDNWKVSSRLSLDYGVRFVHQTPQVDEYGQATTFFPNEWSRAAAPLLYVAGCVNNASPCSGANRQAMHPGTGQLLGAGSALAIGTVVPNTGNPTNGLKLQGQGISRDGYLWPALAVAPRLGAAYDVSGTQSLVLRGSVGLYYDRPGGNFANGQGTNPPVSQIVTLRYGQLQNLGGGGLRPEAASTLSGLYEYEPSGLPSSLQWNGGTQASLPWSLAADVSYVGQHSWASPVTRDLNSIDLGAAFLAQNQDPTLAANATPGANAVSTDLMRPLVGYGAVTETRQDGWRTYHSLQFSLNRRFTNGISLGFNDTWSLSDRQSTAPRYDHDASGQVVLRADQAEADRLFGTTVNQSHLMRGTFVWDLPDLARGGGGLSRTVATILNDWQLSGVWSGGTGTAYAVNYSYASGGNTLNLTGSPDFGARVTVVGPTGSGCSDDVHRQFDTTAFLGPVTNSVGLESGNGYLRGCFQSALDLAIARNIRMGGGRSIQLRVDMFNAPNAAIITGRQATMQLNNPSDPRTITNLPFDANGLVVARSLPRGAGFGVATNYQAARSIQGQVRFSF